ncbi:MAG: hypothetical protein GY803_18870 [Chloroflexi bacterium]|nr:hypothetical protein [Chloroflexota bacterium]
MMAGKKTKNRTDYTHQDVRREGRKNELKRGLKLFLGLLFVFLLLFINGVNSTAVPDAQAVPLTFLLDWAALPNGAPADMNPYPYVETHTNVAGSGVDVTLTIPETGFNEVYRATDPGGNVPSTYMGSSEVFRYWHDNVDGDPVTIVIDFSQPVIIDEIMIGGNRINGWANGVVEFVAKDASGGLGNVVLPNPSVYPDPSVLANVTSPAALPGTAPLNIIDGSANYFAEYVPARQSYVAVGNDDIYHWAVFDYEGAVVQSLVWEEYCTNVTDPRTARANIFQCNLNSAYLASFNFAPALDWGDLPDTGAGTGAGDYETNSSDNGPSHSLDMVTYMGSCVEAESDGQPDTEAGTDNVGGDDGTSNFVVGSCAVAGDDEDGVSFSGNWSDGTAEMSATSSAAACLNVWLDFTNGAAVGSDGDFDDTYLTVSEHVIQNQLVAAGANSTPFTLPADVADGATFYLRARLTPQDGGGGCTNADAYGGTAVPTGQATGGEVEDYQISFSPTAISLSRVDAQDHSGIWGIWAAVALFIFTILVVLRPQMRKARAAASDQRYSEDFVPDYKPER